MIVIYHSKLWLQFTKIILRGVKKNLNKMGK
jgi:hypothetical protein